MSICVAAIFVLYLTSDVIYGQQCYTAAAYQNLCTTTYGGILNGGRCFFIPNGRSAPSVTQTEAWGICSTYDATLAQIHTDVEHAALVTYINGFSDVPTIYNDGLWLAAYRDPSSTSMTAQNSHIDLALTRWQNSVNNVNALLTAGNTWLRFRVADNDFGDGHLCYRLKLDVGATGDRDCSYSGTALCTVFNQLQNYDLIPNKCMNETVIETSLQAVTTADCATLCSNRVWCRSYNWYNSAKKCDLFSWYWPETGKIATNVLDCYHYAYVP